MSAMARDVGQKNRVRELAPAQEAERSSAHRAQAGLPEWSVHTQGGVLATVEAARGLSNVCNTYSWWSDMSGGDCPDSAWLLACESWATSEKIGPHSRHRRRSRCSVNACHERDRLGGSARVNVWACHRRRHFGLRRDFAPAFPSLALGWGEIRRLPFTLFSRGEPGFGSGRSFDPVFQGGRQASVLSLIVLVGVGSHRRSRIVAVGVGSHRPGLRL